MKKIWNQLGHSLFAEDESSRKTKHILKTVFFFYILVLLKVIVFKYPLARLEAIAASWTKEVVWEGLGTANFTLFKTIRMYIRYWGKLTALKIFSATCLLLCRLASYCRFCKRRAVDSGFCFWTRSCLSAVSSCFSFLRHSAHLMWMIFC